MIFSKKTKTPSFALPLLPPVVIGLALTALFYGLIFAGPLDYALLRRYCLCHEVAVVTVGLFWVSSSAMTMKLLQVQRQRGLLAQSLDHLSAILESPPSSSDESRSQWLSMMWETTPTKVWQSYFGERVQQLLTRQVKRGNTKGLDEDIRELAERDGDRLHDSYGLIRIAIWAMPMLGFLGTVIGIAGTLGQIDSEMLASGSQEAMNRITAGLYVAFDKTAIALALTMVAMFMQFAVQRVEAGLLSQIDESVADRLIGFLADDEVVTFAEPTHDLIEKLTNKLASVVTDVVSQQAELWRATIDEAQQHWQQSTARSEETLQETLIASIDKSLDRHAQYLEEAEAVGTSQIDTRWQQWQTTLSEQSRNLLDYQREQADHLAILNQLLEKVTQLVDQSSSLHRVEEDLTRNIERLTDVDRFHEAAICLTEAIAFLGTHLEKEGWIGNARKRSDSEILSLEEARSQRRRGRAA